MQTASLPYVDEHTAVVSADADAVWRGVGETLDRSFAGSAMARYARLIGASETTKSGPRPFAESSTVPGFRVTRAVPGREMVLEGRHRFSTYALTFRLEPAGPGRTLLRAETRAAFPGLAGGVYRGLVIGTRGHVLGMRRMLASVRRLSER
ncbi:hypothetical protein [Streptomyces sp. NBC_01465]|uniref:hypothetical protein n=1 Tax=Streptomyces sp. NBC_01465 TaxID=2903878 RepID=UPI002E3047B3|nr:hypothetical protein [Streptomyces sp. NBC_01465]